VFDSIWARGGPRVDLPRVKGGEAEIVGVEKSDPTHILVGLNDRDPQFHDVYKVDLKTGKRTLVYKNDIKAVGFVVDHKLHVRAAQTFTPAGTIEILHRADDHAPWQQIRLSRAE